MTGGEDLMLIAMGIVYQKYSDKKVQMQRFNMVPTTVLQKIENM